MIVFIIYASVFINKMGIGVEGEKYHVLMDDAMISMTYAKNFARGKGLVWNESGEKVEGITNLMWTAYMAVPHLLKIDAKKTALFIQISALIFLAFNIFIVY